MQRHKQLKPFIILIVLTFLFIGNYSSVKAEQNRTQHEENQEQLESSESSELKEGQPHLDETSEPETENVKEPENESLDSPTEPEEEKVFEEEREESTEDVETTEEESSTELDATSQIDSTVEEDKTQASTSSSDTSEESNTKTVEENNGKSNAKTIQPYQAPGLINANLFTNTDLEAIYSPLSNGRHQITLIYTARGALNLELLSNTYIIFQLPSEIREVISVEDLTGTYDVPVLSALGINLIRRDGDFKSEDINLEFNRVSMEFSNLLSVDLLSSSDYIFTLTIELDELPPNESGTYTFYSEATDQLVDLSILSKTPASATLGAPTLPTVPSIDEPVYETDTVVTGNGEPGTTVRVEISDGEFRSGKVNTDGTYNIEIPSQPAGTQISAVSVKEINEIEYFSDEVFVVVKDNIPPDPPLIHPVYSKDRVVTGEGEPGTTVHLLMDGIPYEDYTVQVDADGIYTVPIPEQEPGTVISVYLTDEAGNESSITTREVIQAILSFYHVPETLAFETSEIPAQDTRIYRTDPNWSLEVQDTRRDGSGFKVRAQAENPLTSRKGNHILSDALVFVDKEGESQPLTREAVEVYSGGPKDFPITSISWERGEGPLLEIEAWEAYATDYSTEITWTLEDTP